MTSKKKQKNCKNRTLKENEGFDQKNKKENEGLVRKESR